MDLGAWISECGSNSRLTLLFFGKLRPKVKVKYPWKHAFSGPISHRGYVWDYSEPGRVRWGTIGSMPTNFGNLSKVAERQGDSSRKVFQFWQVASVAGNVPNLKKVPVQSIALQRNARCSSPCILHTFRSVNPPHWQWPAPMGSWRVYCYVEYWEICFFGKKEKLAFSNHINGIFHLAVNDSRNYMYFLGFSLRVVQKQYRQLLRSLAPSTFFVRSKKIFVHTK